MGLVMLLTEIHKSEKEQAFKKKTNILSLVTGSWNQRTGGHTGWEQYIDWDSADYKF